MTHHAMALGWALVDFTWQGTFIGLVTAVLLTAMRNTSAEARYAVACLSLGCCAVLPIFAMCVGSSGATLALISFLGTVGVSLTYDLSWRTALQDHLPALIALWAIGFAVLLARLGLGLVWVKRMRDSARGPMIVAAHWQARLDQLARKLRLPRLVPLQALIGPGTPMTVGWWRPVVLVPVSMFARMPVQLLDALLAHELAHIKRHDYAVNVIQSCVEAFLFYHPVTWWLSRRIRVEREHIADGIAAGALGGPRNLALALQQLETIGATSTGSSNTAWLAVGARAGNLLVRIQRLVEPGKRARTGSVVIPVIGLGVMFLVASAYPLPQSRSHADPAAAQTEESHVRRREMESRIERQQPAVGDADRALLERAVEERMAAGSAR